MKWFALGGTVIFLVVALTPSISANSDIEYPKEDGPYTVYCSISSYAIYSFEPQKILLPFCKVDYPNSILIDIWYESGYTLDPVVDFVINGKSIEFLYDEGINSINFSGFTGFLPPLILWNYKESQGHWGLIFGISMKIRLCGLCEEIDIINP